MNLTIHQTTSAIAAVVAGWLMVRAGASTGMVASRTPLRCVACGRRRGFRGCRCTDVDGR